MLLEPIYEQDFLDCSYGFRPGRSAHQALESFRTQLMNSRGGWVLEVDIRKFFDTLDHGHLRKFLQLRVRDGVLLCLIGKWLNAGVMEDGSVSYPDAGSPQGGVVSPLVIERVPALRAGPLVQTRGATSSEVSCLPHPLSAGSRAHRSFSLQARSEPVI
jgi:retron-type reverse transcriptase